MKLSKIDAYLVSDLGLPFHNSLIAMIGDEAMMVEYDFKSATGRVNNVIRLPKYCLSGMVVIYVLRYLVYAVKCYTLDDRDILGWHIIVKNKHELLSKCEENLYGML